MEAGIKAMTVKKEAVEIKCSGCGANFRLWIPAELLSEWSGGEEINCIKCGIRYVIKKGASGIEASVKTEERPPARTAAAPTYVPTAAKAPTAAGNKVLFVDDDKLATAIAENTLSDVKVTLVIARSGEEALKKLESNNISLIVTDLHLKNPEDPHTQLDGGDLLKKIKAMGKLIPSIVTTGKDIIDDLALDPVWFDLQVRGFIQKGNPFWAEELKQKVKELLDIV